MANDWEALIGFDLSPEETAVTAKNDGSYVVVLINGNELGFNPVLLEQGEEGGRITAHCLHRALRIHVVEALPEPKSDVTIIVRVFASISELAKRSSAAEILESFVKVAGFVRSFNNHERHFDFVDVGTGYFDANAKIRASLDFHLKSPLCLRAVLGLDLHGGHFGNLKNIVSRYRPSVVYFLGEAADTIDIERPEFFFRIDEFDDLFDKAKIAIIRNLTSHTTDAPSTSASSLSMLESTETKIRAEVADAVPSPPSRETSLQQISETRTSSSSDTIPRNIDGKRIDSVHSISQMEWLRMRGLHLCHFYFLRQDCLHGSECLFAHELSPDNGGLPDGSLTARDLEILSCFTRYMPCHRGTGCKDPGCVYGHRCLEPETKIFGQLCRKGARCPFPADMHFTDLEVVNMDGSEQRSESELRSESDRT